MIFFGISVILFIIIILQNFFLKKEVIFTYIYAIFVTTLILLIGLKGSNDEYSQFYFNSPYFSEIIIYGLNILKTNFSITSYGYEKELLFLLLISIFKSLNLGAQSLYFLFGSLSLLINAVFLKKYTKFFLFAFLVYVSHHLIFRELSGIRLGISSTFLLPAVYYFVKKKYIWSFIFCLISSQLHNIGYLGFIIFFINFQIKNVYVVFIILLSFIMLYLGIINYVIELLIELSFFPTRIQDYFVSSPGERVSDYSNYIPFNIKIYQQLALIGLIIYLTNKKTYFQLPNYFLMVRNIYFLSTILFINFLSFPIFAVRINAHFMIFEAILISYIIYLIKNKSLFISISSLALLIVSYINYVFLKRIDDYIFLIR